MARTDATPIAMQQDLTLAQVIAGLGDLHGRVNRDEEYLQSVHGVTDHNASVLSTVMARVLSLEQGAVTATGHMKQLGKDAEENDVKLDNQFCEELNEVTTRLGEKNTELMNHFALEREGHLGEDRPPRLVCHWDSECCCAHGRRHGSRTAFGP